MFWYKTFKKLFPFADLAAAWENVGEAKSAVSTNWRITPILYTSSIKQFIKYKVGQFADVLCKCRPTHLLLRSSQIQMRSCVSSTKLTDASKWLFTPDLLTPYSTLCAVESETV